MYSWWQLDMNFLPYGLPKNISNKTTLGAEVCHPGPRTKYLSKLWTTDEKF